LKKSGIHLGLRPQPTSIAREFMDLEAESIWKPFPFNRFSAASFAAGFVLVGGPGTPHGH
jgi:hypothetical protein